MARKSTEQVKEDSKESRFRMRKLIEGGESEGDALGLVFDWNRNRGRSFTTWRRHGLWPIPDDEQDELRAYIEAHAEQAVEQEENDRGIADSMRLAHDSNQGHGSPLPPGIDQPEGHKAGASLEMPKTREQIKEESKGFRLKLHELTKGGMSLHKALKQVLDEDRARLRTFDLWRKLRLWPIPADELEEVITGSHSMQIACDSTEVVEPLEVTGSQQPLEPVIEQPEDDGSQPDSSVLAVDSIPRRATPQSEPEVSADADGTNIAEDSTTPMDIAPPSTDKPPLETDSTRVASHAIQKHGDTVQDSGPVPENQRAILRELTDSYSKPDGELFRMIEEWKAKSDESRALPEHRPVFRSDFDHQITGVRIKSYIWEAAKQKMLTEKVKTGGSMSALIELLLWEYAGRPEEALEGDTTALEGKWFSKKGGAGN